MERQTGRVEFYDEHKGYGFIKPEGGGKDLLLRYYDIHIDSRGEINKHDRVEYDLIDGSAKNIRKIDKRD